MFDPLGIDEDVIAVSDVREVLKKRMSMKGATTVNNSRDADLGTVGGDEGRQRGVGPLAKEGEAATSVMDGAVLRNEVRAIDRARRGCGGARCRPIVKPASGAG